MTSVSGALDAWLGLLPRLRVGRAHREAPTFRTCGIVGYYAALIVTMGGGLLGGRSLTALALVSLVCALSFFAWAHFRRWLTGRETLVLLEHVWFALACSTATLWVLGEPVLAHLDVVAVALCVFLAWGRVGCLLVGCCYGVPSSVGVVYDARGVPEGFPSHLVGVRLLPVQAIECVVLLLVGFTGLVALPFALPGRVFVWVLLAYAIARFGLEGLRADERPHFLGWSQAQWMAVGEVGVALAAASWTPLRPSQGLIASTLSLAALVGLLRQRRSQLRKAAMLSQTHTNEVRQAVERLLARTGGVDTAPTLPQACLTSQGASVATTPGVRSAHVSLALPPGQTDLRLLCDLATRTFPDLLPESAVLTAPHLLQFLLPNEATGAGSARTSGSHVAVYEAIVRTLQAADRARVSEPGEAPSPCVDSHTYFGADRTASQRRAHVA